MIVYNEGMKLTLASEKDMQDLGNKLAKKLPSGSVIELIGDVGTGKTTLVKGIGRGLGILDTIQSPSYTIFCRYDSGKKSLHHYDFYRLNDPGLISYDLEESLHTKNATVVIEWSDHIKEILPDDHIRIRISVTGENKRQVNIEGMKI